jgi:hypothetical protein
MTRTRRVQVVGVGPPPSLPLRPLVDEVLLVLAKRQKPSSGSIDDFRPRPPAAVEPGARRQRMRYTAANRFGVGSLRPAGATHLLRPTD